MQKKVLATLPHAELRVYVVWLPVLSRMSPEALRGAARSGAKQIPDTRARHFLDAEAQLGELYVSILALSEDFAAWDVYMLFGPATRWEEKPPAPTYWMHQLYGGPPGQRLDAAKLAGEVEKLLSATKMAPRAEAQELNWYNLRRPRKCSSACRCRPLRPASVT